MKTCFICEKEALILCSHCRDDCWFCCLDHKDLHRFDTLCFPFKVSKSPLKGRHLVATRDLFPEEIVLIEPIPASQSSKILELCLSCDGPLSDQKSFCPCSLGKYFCSQLCSSGSFHPECSLLRHHIIPMSQILLSSLLYIRLLCLSKDNPKEWSRVTFLKSNYPSNDRETDQIRDYIVSLTHFELKEISFVLGIGKINCIQSPKRVFLYPTMALLNNSCICNCRCIPSSHHGLVVRTQVSVKKGEELTIQYSSLFSGSLARKRDFERNWNFTCDCSRCRDPTENGSYLNAFLCSICSQPSFLLSPEWKCAYCGFSYSEIQISTLESKIQKEIEFCSINIVSLRELLKNYEGTLLHSSHYLLMKIKSILISSLGNVPGYLLSELSDELLEFKNDICTEFLYVFEKVDPGTTDWMAVTKYELIQVRLALLERKFNITNDERNTITEQLFEYERTLKDIVRILEQEIPGSYLWTKAQSAKVCRQNIKELIRFVEFL